MFLPIFSLVDLSVVNPQDKVYVLGDVTISRKRSSLDIVSQLNGHKRLVMGNHDVQPVSAYLDAGFEKVMAYRVLDNILFSHIPIHPSQFVRFRGNVHGHMHDASLWPDTRYLNVCVEMTNYLPVSFDLINRCFSQGVV